MVSDTFIETFINLYLTFILIHALWYKKTILSNEITLQKELALDKLTESKFTFEKFMCKTRFTFNVNLFDIITFIIALIGLSIIMTIYATKIIVGYKYNFSLCIISFIYISVYLISIYLPVFFITKPRKTKKHRQKTV
ncbi:hypothetical protein PDJ82_26830 [Bacillus cereus group sp. TH43LC]|uniref:hypothetical protein n=1 Tax=Bacillus cereus group sp. TH43LC TaxID=3018037 RepID=UPI0022E28CE8|nr:hypothetical protein [Bacillus cereus group sp. TH43LC]MDA1505184.1 hypothetical protein [Bacillus cereus group sp. TH43LC]